MIAASVTTLLGYLRTFCRCSGIHWPRDPQLARVLEALHRTTGRAPRRVDPLRLAQIKLLVPLQPTDTLAITLILTSHHAMLRGQELLALRWSDVSVLPSGDVVLSIPPAADKSNRSHVARRVLVPHAMSPAACSLSASKLLQQPSAYLCPWRSHQAWTRTIQRVCLTSGVQGHFTPHSMRAGGATDYLAGGAPPERVRHNGRWASDAYTRYWRPHEAEDAAHLAAAALSQVPVGPFL